MAVAASLMLALAGCGDDGEPDISVEGAIIPAPAGANGALYFDLVNDGDGDDRLVEVRTDAAATVELHETVAGDDGLSRMVPLEDVEVGAGETVAFEPGGRHVMLLGVEPLAEGDVVTVELELATSGVVEIEVAVGTVADALD